MRGQLIINAFWHSASMARMIDLFMDAARDQSITLTVRTNADALCELQLSCAAPPCDFVLLWDKDIRLGQLLEKRGVPVFNAPQAIADCDDKTITCLRLMDRGIPMPTTLLCPQIFPGCDLTNDAFIESYADKLGLPLVIKEGCGSFGQQVYLAHTVGQAREIVVKSGAAPMLFQKFIKESAGRDLRLYMVDGQCVAAMERVNLTGDFRANIAGGGTARNHAPTPEETRIARDACDALNLTFAGVDILLSNDGPLLCEVNSNAHFAALYDLTGVNPAQAILSAIGRKLCAAT